MEEEEEEAVLRFGQNSKTAGRQNSGPRDPSLPPSLPPSFTVAEAGGGREGGKQSDWIREREGTVDGRKEGLAFDEFPRTEVSENSAWGP